jgi:hypothetical protein
MTLRPRPTANLKRKLETLEDRSLLSAQGLGGGHMPPPRALVGGPPAGLFAAGFAARGQAGAAPWSAPPQDVAGQTVLSVQLSDSTSGASAAVNYRTNGDDTRLAVVVKGAEADATLDVSVAGTVVGQITTDANGAGKLVLSSDPHGHESALPDDFPTDVAVDTAVSVGTLSGTLVAGPLACPAPLGIGLVAPLSDANNSTARGVVGLRTFASETEVVVKVSGAEASSSLDVTIGDTVVGQLETDENGAGKLVLSTDPTDDETDLPDDVAAAITTGTTVSVGTLTGNFATPTRPGPFGGGPLGGGGFGGGGFGSGPGGGFGGGRGHRR